MRAIAFTLGVLMSTAAIAGPGHEHKDDVTPAATLADANVDAADADTALGDPAPVYTAQAIAPAGPSVQQPDNSNPERDARGIAVISDAAAVPAGFNGDVSTGVGGPELDPATGEDAGDSYPACSRTITDNCVQTYERQGR